jgi:hypothetical protein
VGILNLEGIWLRVRCSLRGYAAFLIVVSASHSAFAQQSVLDTSNAQGVLRTITLDGGAIDQNNPFFQSLGTNGRSCVSCHVPANGWTISPDEVQRRFNKTKGLDPIFRTNDGSNSPNADVSTLTARRSAYSMLLSKGVIRVGMPIPAGAEFELAAVNDPYGYASAGDLSLFRRPLPSTNLRFLTAVMWDGRESFTPMGTTPFLDDATDEANALALLNNLKHQANDATQGHAQGAALTDAQQLAIARFEMNLATAQHTAQGVGVLNARGTLGGAEHLCDQPFFVTINDVFGGDKLSGNFDPHAMKLFDAWSGAHNPKQAAIARGAALFGSIKVELRDVGGLNDALGIPVISASCTACHDTPNVGNHSVSLPVDLGLTDASRRTLDMPLYTLRNLTTGETRQTTDPGRALLTGRWADIGKFKGPILRGLAARAPYFHDGSAADLGEVLDFYEERFDIGLTAQQRSDLITFLSAL